MKKERTGGRLEHIHMNPLNRENMCELFVDSYRKGMGEYYYGWACKYEGELRAYGGPLNPKFPTQNKVSSIYCGLAHGCGWLRSWMSLQDLSVIFKVSDSTILDSFLMESSHPVIHIATISIINNVIGDLLDSTWRIVHPTKNVAFRYARKSAKFNHEMFY